jgi:glucose/arabinose dehydrogenase/chitodextrinase
LIIRITAFPGKPEVLIMLSRIFAAATAAFFSLVISLLSFELSTVKAFAIPSDFEDVVIANVGGPTALAFTPDGRLLITTQGGQVRIYQNGSLLPNAAINLGSRLCTNSERGLLGVAVDPNFSSNRFVYFFYTFNKFNTCPTGQPTNTNNPVNRVSRFVLADDNTISLSSETVLIDNIHSPNGNHNGGDLHFGKDGLLYISVGDGGADYAGNSGGAGANDAARDRHVLLGKILRITRDGAIPSGNPFQGSNSGRCNTTGITTAGNWCQEIFATGLRNPFRIAFDLNASGTRFFINDVGQNTWEEIDEGIAGADYGWNIREGHCANGSTTNCGAPPAGLTNPVFDYPRGCVANTVSGNSITGGAFVPNGVWSSEYDNSYLFGEYVCGKIFRIKPNGSGGFTATEFGAGVGGVTTMIFGPYQNTQALYYANINGGQVRRIRYTGSANRNPVASATANPTAGAAPLNVAFNASGSTDPDGDALTFSWNFGDGATGTGATPTHTYAAVGTYTAVVTVSDGRGGVATASVRIDVGNTAPVPAINTPTASQLFRVGETITLNGAATDAQDGSIPNNRLTWEVILHHNNDHTHPFVPPTPGNNITFTAPAPEDLPAAIGSFLEIRLTATDANGLSATVTRNFQPRKVNITLATQPAGLNLTVNGLTVSGATTFVSWDGYALNVNAPDQTFNNRSYIFQSWSDGGARAHTITTPAMAATYTAVFQAAPTFVTVSGRVTRANGSGVPRAIVTMTDSRGAARFAMTNPSGYYRFTNVLTGETYVFAVTTKSPYGQTTQTRTVTEEASGINFTVGN